MRHGKTWSAAVVFAAAVAVAGTAFGEGLKVAVIDVNKILNESAAGKDAKKKIEARYEELKKKLDAKQDEARKLKDEIDKQKILLGKEKLKEKEDALNTKVTELRQLTQEAEKEMQGRQGDATRDVLKIIEAQMEKVVNADKIDVVLEKSQGGVVYFNPALEITAKVQDLVNKENPIGK